MSANSHVAVWAEHLEGFVRVGVLEVDSAGAETFSYDPDYLSRPDATPIYPPLPLREGAHSTHATRAAWA